MSNRASKHDLVNHPIILLLAHGTEHLEFSWDDLPPGVRQESEKWLSVQSGKKLVEPKNGKLRLTVDALFYYLDYVAMRNAERASLLAQRTANWAISVAVIACLATIVTTWLQWGK